MREKWDNTFDLKTNTFFLYLSKIMVLFIFRLLLILSRPIYIYKIPLSYSKHSVKLIEINIASISHFICTYFRCNIFIKFLLECLQISFSWATILYLYHIFSIRNLKFSLFNEKSI